MDLTRRNFIKVGFAVASAAALAGCGRPVEHPLVSQYGMPEYRLPGVPVFFASTCGECGSGCGVAVRVMHGRANHVMGIPSHPISRGRVCARSFAALQALYHPERLEKPLQKGQPSDWAAASKALVAALQARPALWIVDRLSGSTGSLIGQMAAAGGGKVWVLDTSGQRAERMAVKAVTGRAELAWDDFATSDYVVNFGGDPLGGNNQVASNAAYGEFRTRRLGKPRGILVTFSTRMNLTGASSDRWIPVRPGGEGWAALGLTKALQAAGRGSAPGWAAKFTLEQCGTNAGVDPEIFTRLAARLLHAERPLVLGGAESGGSLEGVASLRLIYSLNRALGRDLRTWEPDLVTGSFPPSVLVSAQEAMQGLSAGTFQSVFVHGVDPAYLLPSALGFAAAFGKAKSKVAFASFQDDTTKLCDLVLPTATWLEAWGDARLRTPDGDVYGVQQPAVVARGFDPKAEGPSGSRGLLEILVEAAKGAGVAAPSAATAQAMIQGNAPEIRWENMLVRGGVWPTVSLDYEPYETHVLNPPPAVPNPGSAPAGISPWTGLAAAGDTPLAEPKADESGQFTLIAYESVALGDGRHANQPWMLELPDPLTSIPWNNYVELNPATAQKLSVTNGDWVTLKSDAGDVTLPAVVMPGIHPEAVAVPMGWGQTSGLWSGGLGQSVARVLSGAYQAGSGDVAWTSTKVSVLKASGSTRLTQLDVRVNGLPRRALPH